ncbi:extracellular ligand-binding receptor [Arthrobacter sp. Hiyo6]|nr:extracellular ligand-binding receptor [Arthrobacter sp. Hiyo6]
MDKVLAAKPDAIALITFDQAKSIVPLMTGKGVKRPRSSWWTATCPTTARTSRQAP